MPGHSFGYWDGNVLRSGDYLQDNNTDFLEMKQTDISTEALDILTCDEAFHYRLVPYKVDSDANLYCFCDDKRDYDASVREIAIVYGFNVRLLRVSSEELTQMLCTCYRQPEQAEEPGLSPHPDFVVNLIDEAYGLKASDIHMEPFENKCRVRFRIDGRLIEKHIIKQSEYPGIVNRIKILSNLDISEKRLPQDGRIMYSHGKTKFDIRTSVMPVNFGEKIVLRLLASDGKHLTLEELGLDERQMDDYLASISRPHGLILISGPTGSGKSTTLYATLERLNRVDNNILTIEDPIEYTLEGVSQMQLKEEIGLTFPVALRTFLRQDPDIIMLGEIRDEDTAEMAIRSSLTGHLLLSTLHTNSAWGCITRLTDMGVHPYLLSETLLACVAQRLVRLLCPDCKRESEGHFVKTGCPRCHYTGYRGRKAVYEIIRMDEHLSSAVRDRIQDVDEYLARKGVKTLKDSALALYENGETSYEEIIPLLNDSL